MDTRTVEILATRRAEAIALLEANQRGRTRGSLALASGLLVIVVAGTVGIACDTPALAIPVPTVLLLLMSELFQYYADVTVLGAARRRLEELVNAELAAPCLIYESFVADIRKRPPLVRSERVLQTAAPVTVLGSIVVATLVTYTGQPGWVEILFPVATLAGIVTATLSYRAMRQSGPVAAAALSTLEPSSARPPGA
jgi:hypothetical protein